MRCLTTIVTVFVVGLLSCILAQENLPSKDELLEKLPGLADIPGIDNFNASALPNVEDAKNLFKKKCEKNGGPNAFATAQKAQEDMVNCVKSLVNVTELQAEMEIAKPTGDLDVVFRKYCMKRTSLKNCVTAFTDAVEPCLEVKERESKKIVLNITESLLNFVCFKEGDRIALFIAESGPECLQSKQQAVQDCANTTVGGTIPSVIPNTGSFVGLESLPNLVLGAKECSDISKFQACAVRELETCKNPTPANIVNALFDFIMKVTPCESLRTKTASPVSERNVSGDATSRAANALLTTIFLAISIRFV